MGMSDSQCTVGYKNLIRDFRSLCSWQERHERDDALLQDALSPRLEELENQLDHKYDYLVETVSRLKTEIAELKKNVPEKQESDAESQGNIIPMLGGDHPSNQLVVPAAVTEELDNAMNCS